MTAAADADRPFAGASWTASPKSRSASMFRMLSLYRCVGWAAENGRKVTPGILSMAARWDSVPMTKVYSLFTAAGTALLPPTTVGDSSVNPPVLYWARPAADSVYFTNAIAAGVGLPMTVMSITCGEPLFVALAPLLVIVTVALAYCAASAALARLMASGSLMYGRCSSIAWVMNALEASSWPDCSVESSEDSA